MGPPRSSGFFAGPRPLVIGHRGAAGLFPENTLPSFEGALALGCRHLETDLHRTRDGVLVCHHDDTVDRTTNGRGRVQDFTLSELKKLDAGYAFEDEHGGKPFRACGVRIPTLEELVALDGAACLNLEIKQRSPDVTAELWRFIDARGLHDRVLVAAQDDRVGVRFQLHARGRVPTSPGKHRIAAFRAASWLGLERGARLGFDALQVPLAHRGVRLVEPRFVAAAHRVGVEVHAWTINDEDEMRRLVELGVDAIITDRPDVLGRVLGRVRA